MAMTAIRIALTRRKILTPTLMELVTKSTGRQLQEQLKRLWRVSQDLVLAMVAILGLLIWILAQLVTCLLHLGMAVATPDRLKALVERKADPLSSDYDA